MKMFFSNLWYYIKCTVLAPRNPNNPAAPRLRDLKPGTKFKVDHTGSHGYTKTYTIKRVFWVIASGDRLKFTAEVEESQEEIFLSDAGVVPYQAGWINQNVPYLLDK